MKKLFLRVDVSFNSNHKAGHGKLRETTARNGSKGFPYFGYFLIPSFFILFFVLALDFIFRSEVFLKQLSFSMVFRNIAVMSTMFFPLFLILSLVFLMIEALLYRIIKKYDKPAVSAFITCLIIIYVNLLYLKFYLFSFTDIDRESIIKLMAVLYIILLPVLFHRFMKILKKLDINRAGRFSLRILSAFFIIVFLVSGFSFYGIFRDSKKAEPPVGKKRDKPHIIMLTFDSLNAGHMSLYGYWFENTPFLNEFSKRAVVFQRMIANSSSTLYSLPCFLGHYPQKHTIPIENSFVGVLGERGYKERHFVSFSYGMAHGFFDDFSNVLTFKIKNNEKLAFAAKYINLGFLVKSPDSKSLVWILKYVTEKNSFFNLFSADDPNDLCGFYPGEISLQICFDLILDTLKNADGPVFFWNHAYEPHTPSYVPAKYKSDAHKPWQRYDLCIRFIDEKLEMFINRLEKEGLLDNCILIISSDHGEGFKGYSEGGVSEVGHGSWKLTEEITHIPLIIRFPRQTIGSKPATFCEMVDLGPTILDYLGIDIPEWMAGESLLAYIENPEKMSEKVKISVPPSYFYRKFEKDVSFKEMFNLFWYKYKLGLFLYYERDENSVEGEFEIADPGSDSTKPGFNRVLTGFEPYGLWDLSGDPLLIENLLEDEKNARIIDRMIHDPLFVKYLEEKGFRVSEQPRF